LGKLPDEVRTMDLTDFNGMILYLDAKAIAQKLKV
jgi:hypothetical protein